MYILPSVIRIVNNWRRRIKKEGPTEETITEEPRIEIQKPKIMDRFLKKLSDMVEKID